MSSPALSSEHIKRNVARKIAAMVGLLAVGYGLVPGLYYAGYVNIETVNMLGRYMTYAIVAVGLDLVWGYTGILCLCQSLFFTIGGYAMGMYLALHGPLDEGVPRALYVVSSSVTGITLPWFWKPFDFLLVAVALGLLLPGLLGLTIGYFGFANRVRGVYFSILTQAITFAAYMVFCLNNLRLCGTNGLTNFVELAGFNLKQPQTKLCLYLLTLTALVGVYALCRYITLSRLGRVLIAIRDNESRLRFSGYKPHHFKVFVFTLSAMIAGLGGLLYVPQENIITPTFTTVEKSILVVIWVAVGGRGTLSGAILGALAVNLVYNFLTSRWPESWPFVQGSLFVGVVLFFPDGLISLPRALAAHWRRIVGATTRPSVEPQPSPPEPGGGEPLAARDSGSALEEVQRRLNRVSLMQRSRPPTLPKDDLVRVENVKVLFDGFKALDIEAFSVGYYELRVIIGPNGAGKTTLCDVISGKTRASSGRVMFASQDITSLSDVAIARLGVGRKFQTPTVFDSLTVYENMELALPGRQGLLRNFTSRQTPAERERIQNILRRVRLIGQADTRVKFLSHGQRQWLEISMLILASPILLLIDEPAAGLSDEETVLTAELLLELQDEHSIIVIEHDMDFVRLLASRVAVLNEGKIMADGTMEQVQADPNVIEAYLGR